MALLGMGFWICEPGQINSISKSGKEFWVMCFHYHMSIYQNFQLQENVCV